MTRAVVYTRISRDPEGEALGVARQRLDCLDRASREGWTVVDILVENDVGASSYSRKPRPVYAELLQRARRREFDVILAYSNSRLTRRPLELEELIRLHEATGVRLCTVVSGDDDLGTADGRMVARIKASVDAGEAERVSERTRRAKLQRARQGQPMTGGGRPFGYANDRLTVIDEEAAAIRDAANRVLGGESLVSIVAEWNRAGTPATVHGGLWTQRTLRGILRSPRIAGLSEHKGKVVGTAVWPAIIDRDSWERIRAEISAPGHGKHEHRLLSGLLRCVCGSRMSPTGRAGLYRCAPVPGTGGCGRVARKYGPLEEWVVERWADHMTKLTGSEYWTREEDLTSPDDDVLAAEEDEVTRRIGTLRDRWAAGQIGDEDFFPLIAQLRSRLAQIDHDRKLHQPLIVQGETVTGVALRVAWPQLLEMVGYREDERDKQRGIAAQRAMLAQHIDRITVGPVATRGSHTFDPSTVSITWRTLIEGGSPRASTRLVGPRIQLEFQGRASPDQPATEWDA
jgi:site-specific DNA recombinase